MATPEPIEGALNAWAEDEQERERAVEDYRALLQVRVIPLVAVWGLANHALVDRDHTAYQFLQDYMSSDERTELWRRQATAARDMSVTVAEGIPTERYANMLMRSINRRLPASQFERLIFLDGRPSMFTGNVSGVEMSLLGSIAHALYNNNGNILLQMRPLGAHRDHPRDFLWHAGPRVTGFVEEHFPEK